jgi:hypothetical protein
VITNKNISFFKTFMRQGIFTILLHPLNHKI